MIPVYRAVQVTLSHPPGSWLPLLSTRPAVTSVAFTRWRRHTVHTSDSSYYSFIDPKRMKGWVGRPVADGLPTCGHQSAASWAWDRESSPTCITVYLSQSNSRQHDWSCTQRHQQEVVSLSTTSIMLTGVSYQNTHTHAHTAAGQAPAVHGWHASRLTESRRPVTHETHKIRYIKTCCQITTALHNLRGGPVVTLSS